MRRVISIVVILLLLVTLTGCSSSAKTQSDTSIAQENTNNQTGNKSENEASTNDSNEQNNDVSISVGTQKSVELPKDFPASVFPIYPGSYIATAMGTGNSYTVTAYTTDDIQRVVAFYSTVLEGAKVTAETKTEESLTSFGTKGGYTYTLDVGNTNDMKGFRTSIVLSIQATSP
ncbi:hypothetical protein HPY42_00910 [Coprothermobacteraceae bacterium]|nr:hypothetical protein [Coprothermobacteraceae bacterium]